MTAAQHLSIARWPPRSVAASAQLSGDKFPFRRHSTEWVTSQGQAALAAEKAQLRPRSEPCHGSPLKTWDGMWLFTDGSWSFLVKEHNAPSN
jgi:hypothetical protein